MLKILRLTAAPLVVLLALMSGCSTEQREAISPSPTLTSSLSTEPTLTPVASTPPQSPQTDLFQDANDKAIGATTISQSAQSKNDWDLVFGMWLESISLMKSVPTSSPSYALAQKKLIGYQHSLVLAKQMSVKPSSLSDLTIVKKSSNLIAAKNLSTSQPVVEFSEPAYDKSTGEELLEEASVDKSSSGSCNYSWQTDSAGRNCGSRAADVRSGGSSGGTSSYSSGSSSSGSTYVRGYTRSNGTRVRGYSRRR